MFWKREAGAERPTREIVALFTNREIALVTIRDPYALGSSRARQAQVQFVALLTEISQRVDAVIIQYAPDAESRDDEPLQRRDVSDLFFRSVKKGPPKLTLARREKRSRQGDDDFHDRSIEIDVREDNRVGRHEILIGRGVEALFDSRKQCTVTYVPPTGATT
jgi:hypothetical protein